MQYSKRKLSVVTFACALLVAVGVPAVFTAQSAFSATGACTSPGVDGSKFEIDTDANLVVNDPDCIDWLSTAGTIRSDVAWKNDRPSGTTDDSFGQGTSENDANPTIVTGSIPPNKSDLKSFGVLKEVGDSDKYVHLFWTRINNPSGTTNMDFELNQKFCDPSATPTNCANNGKNVTPETPARTSGDKLITYDLSKGGTVPTISLRTWSGSAWGPATVISTSSTDARGSVNTSAISAADAGGTGGLGARDPYTFGEATISFHALFGDSATCTTLGSAYLKSRSSDSFTSEIKDFVSPERVTISNCTTISTSATATATLGSPISDTATLSGATSNAGGTITFRLFSDATCSTEVSTGLSPVPVNGPGNYPSGSYTPTAEGTYYWIASYSGDGNNGSATGACGDAGETSVVSKLNTTLATAQSLYPQDSATVSSTDTPSGGTVTFSLYGPNDTSCTGTAVYTETVNVGSNGTAATSNQTFAVTSGSSAVYRWKVHYSGDTTHNSSDSACGNEQFTLSITN